MNRDVLHLAIAPVVQAELFGKFGVKDEQELGERFKKMVMSKMPLVKDPVIVDYIEGIMDRLKDKAPPQPFPLEVNVLKNTVLNAFAAPGGHLFIHTGLLLHLDHESEVAGVMAHELAHVTYRHIASRINQMQTFSLLTLAGALAGLLMATTENSGDAGAAVMAGTMAASQTAMLEYSRDDEREADNGGMQYLAEAGYPPAGMIGAFEKIKAKQFLTGSGAPEYLSTHPGVDSRIEEMRNQLKRLPPDVQARQNDDTQFKRVQTLIRAWQLSADSALDYYNTLTDPDCMDTLGRAIALSRLQRVNEAQEAFSKAMACAPGDPLVARETGRFQYQTGNFKAAAMNLQRAVIQNPRDDMALFFYARLLGDTGQPDQAAKYYEQILKRLPEESDVHFFYGRLLGQKQKLFEAHLHLAYSAFYGHDKKQVEFHRNKIESLAKTKEQKAQVAEFDEINKPPDDESKDK